MEPLVPTQNGNPINTVGIPGEPVNTNVTLADKQRAEAALASVQQNNQVITPANQPDYSRLQVNMTMPSLTPEQQQVRLEEMAKSGSPVVTMEDVKNGGIVVDGKPSQQQSQPKEVNTNVANGGNTMNQNMQQPVNNNVANGGMNNMNQYQQPMNMQYQMPMQQIQPQPKEDEGFFSNPTVKTVGIGVACAAAGYLGHKYLSGSDSAEIAAALGELL